MLGLSHMKESSYLSWNLSFSAQTLNVLQDCLSEGSGLNSHLRRQVWPWYIPYVVWRLFLLRHNTGWTCQLHITVCGLDLHDSSRSGRGLPWLPIASMQWFTAYVEGKSILLSYFSCLFLFSDMSCCFSISTRLPHFHTQGRTGKHSVMIWIPDQYSNLDITQKLMDRLDVGVSSS